MALVPVELAETSKTNEVLQKQKKSDLTYYILRQLSSKTKHK